MTTFHGPADLMATATEPHLDVADHNGWTPCALPAPLELRLRAAVRRGEARIVDARGDGFAVTVGRHRVIVSTQLHNATGRCWVHLSASRPDGRLPSWPELVHLRDVLLGDDVEAYQIAPPRDRYVNRNAGVLHLWACLDGPVLPDMTAIASDGARTI